MESGVLTLPFLEDFLPPWDKIKFFTAVMERDGYEDTNSISTTIIRKVKVEFENGKKVFLVVKTCPLCPLKLQRLRRLKLFPKEIFFYDKLLPEFRRLQSNCESEEKSCLRLSTPPFLAGAISNINNDPLATFMAMTDLRPTRGFKCPDLKKGLNYEHCKLVMKEIAKLHALSWVYRKTKVVKSLQVFHPIIEETILCEENKQEIQAILTMHFDIFQKLVEKSLENDSQEAQRLETFRRDFADILIKYVNPNGLNEREMEKEFLYVNQPDKDESEEFVEESWAVGSHGDLKQDNLLFRYKPNTTEPIEVALVDFQHYRESCPTIDLAYFIYTITDYQMRQKHLNELLEQYQDNFIHFCKLLNKDPYPGFNLKTLKRRFHRAKVFGLLSAILVLPGIFLEQSQPSETSADANGNFADFLIEAKRVEEDIVAMQNKFVDLAKEFCEQGII